MNNAHVSSPVLADFQLFTVYPHVRDLYASYFWDPLLSRGLFAEQLRNKIPKTDKA